MGLSLLPPLPSITYKREVFLASSTFTLPVTAFNKFDAVLVSGGGGGPRNGPSGQQGTGGCGMVAFFQDVFCTNGTTLTVTVGAGGAGQTALDTNGNNGNASTITGIAGNGVSTSISSGIAQGGIRINVTSINFALSPQVAFGIGNSSNNASRSQGRTAGFGMGMVSFQSGLRTNTASNISTIFGSNAYFTGYSCNTVNGNFMRGGTGGPVPLLGSLLHSNVGTSGTAGTAAGGSSSANTYFAGNGGSGSYLTAGNAGVGGGGGAGGGSTSAGTPTGTGGNGSANSGGGGGSSGGRNSGNTSNQGNGGSGGSGFIVIGYWG